MALCSSKIPHKYEYARPDRLVLERPQPAQEGKFHPVLGLFSLISALQLQKVGLAADKMKAMRFPAALSQDSRT